MTISTLSSYGLQSSQSSALQALLARLQSADSDQATSASGTGDRVSVSYIAQYLSRAPKDIAASLQDLVTARKDVTADLQALKTYYAANPKELSKLEAAIQLQGLNPTQVASMTPAMQAGVMDLFALAKEGDTDSTTATSQAELGKAILAALDEGSSDLQGSLLDSLDGGNQASSTGKDRYSLFSYLG